MKVALVVYGDFSRFDNPSDLSAHLIYDLTQCSHGIAKYEITVRMLHPEQAPQNNPPVFPGADYDKIIHDNDLDGRASRGEIDEVWLWGNGTAGFFEAVMFGTGAIDLNGGPLPGYSCPPTPIMGLNYERGVPEALHSYGHRAENCIGHMYNQSRNYNVPAPVPTDDYQRFMRFEKQTPGYCGFGNVHFPPLATKDYEYDCPGSALWGSTEEGFLLWWFSAMPSAWWQATLKPLARWSVTLPAPQPFYRLRTPAPISAYFYTASAAERDNAVKNYGFVYEGVSCEVLP